MWERKPFSLLMSLWLSEFTKATRMEDCQITKAELPYISDKSPGLCLAVSIPASHRDPYQSMFMATVFKITRK